MGFFAALTAFLTAIPKLVSLAENLIQLATSAVEEMRKANLIKKVELASKLAVESKDTSELENIFRGKK